MNTALLEILLMAETIERSTEQALRGTHTDGGGVLVIEERFADIALPMPRLGDFGSWWGGPDILRSRRTVQPPPEPTGPLARICPRCKAGAGVPCRRDGSFRLSRKHRFHKGRTDK